MIQASGNLYSTTTLFAGTYNCLLLKQSALQTSNFTQITDLENEKLRNGESRPRAKPKQKFRKSTEKKLIPVFNGNYAIQNNFYTKKIHKKMF